MLPAPFQGHPLQKRTEVQWDMRAWLHADGGANESMSPQLGIKQVGARVHLQWVIYFPWVPDAGKFKGEVIYPPLGKRRAGSRERPAAVMPTDLRLVVLSRAQPCKTCAGFLRW